MNYREKLMDRINKLLSGTYSVSEFRDAFYMYQLEQIPDNGVSEVENDFFSYIREQLDWTDSNPDEESKKDGWKSENEYISLVKENLQRFLDNEKKWHEDYESSWKK